MTSIRRFAPPELFTAGAGIVLLIGMLAFPWYHETDPWIVVHGERPALGTVERWHGPVSMFGLGDLRDRDTDGVCDLAEGNPGQHPRTACKTRERSDHRPTL